MGLEEPLICHMSLLEQRRSVICPRVWLLLKQNSPLNAYKSKWVQLPAGSNSDSMRFRAASFNRRIQSSWNSEIHAESMGLVLFNLEQGT